MQNLKGDIKLVFDLLNKYQQNVDILIKENESLKNNDNNTNSIYDLEEIQKRVIIKCFNENSEKTIDEIAILLNTTSRTTYRYMKKYNIKAISKKGKRKLKNIKNQIK